MSLRWRLCMWCYPFLVRSNPLPPVLSESSSAGCTLDKHRIYSIRYNFPKDFCFIFSLRVFSFLACVQGVDSFPSKATGVLENQSSNWGWSRESKLLLFEFCWWLEAVLIRDSSTYTAALLGARQNPWQWFLFPNGSWLSKRGENIIMIWVSVVENRSDLTLQAVVSLKTLILKPEWR